MNSPHPPSSPGILKLRCLVKPEALHLTKQTGYEKHEEHTDSIGLNFSGGRVVAVTFYKYRFPWSASKPAYLGALLVESARSKVTPEIQRHSGCKFNLDENGRPMTYLVGGKWVLMGVGGGLVVCLFPPKTQCVINKTNEIVFANLNPSILRSKLLCCW